MTYDVDGQRPVRYHVDSEVGRLRQVIVHRPGTELKRLTPENREALLFDDVVWVHRAQEEHDQFTGTLRENGVEVLYLSDLLSETLAISEAREHVLAAAFDEHRHGRAAGDALWAMATAMTPAEQADLVIGGITKREVLQRIDGPPSLTFHVLGIDDFVLPPLPNHLFTRDTSCWVYDGVAVGAMRMAARERESAAYEAIYRWHPRFTGGEFHRWGDGGRGPGEATIEGGDVLVLGDGVVLVGMSERTTPQGVERLAARLFASRSARTVVAVVMPKLRAFMHLDTVMTMVDRGTFITYEGLGDLPAYTLTPGGDADEVVVTDHPSGMRAALSEAMGTPLRFLVPEQDLHSAAREQWDDGCNTLALSPGVVVTYDRTTTSNAALRAAGIEVLETPGSELGRGRGGPRCLSCPTIRDAAD